jgi:hypothetical protein
MNGDPTAHSNLAAEADGSAATTCFGCSARKQRGHSEDEDDS